MLLRRRLLEGVIEFESNSTPCDKPTLVSYQARKSTSNFLLQWSHVAILGGNSWRTRGKQPLYHSRRTRATRDACKQAIKKG